MSLDNLMEQTIDEPLETSRPLIPEGDYEAIISNLQEIREVTSRKTGDTLYILPITWELTPDGLDTLSQLDSDVAQALGGTIRITQDVWLDVKDGGLDLGPGKNIGLGRVRAAVGQNAERGWNIRSLEGAGPALIRIGTRSINEEGTLINTVSRITALD